MQEINIKPSGATTAITLFLALPEAAFRGRKTKPIEKLDPLCYSADGDLVLKAYRNAYGQVFTEIEKPDTEMGGTVSFWYVCKPRMTSHISGLLDRLIAFAANQGDGNLGMDLTNWVKSY